MVVLNPDLIEVDHAPLEAIRAAMKSLYRMVIYSPHYSDDDLVRKYLDSSHRIHELLAIKNAQMEAQTEEEAERYLRNLRRAFDFIAGEIIHDRTFSGVGDLFRLFRVVAPETHALHPSRFRDQLVQVGSHVGPLPAEVPYRIDSFFHRMRTIGDPIIRAIYTHHELVRIHPFYDGNGRVSRMAKNWILLYELFPPIYINDQAEKQEYVRSLADSFEALERSPMSYSEHTHRFFMQEIERLKRSVDRLFVEVSSRVRADDPGNE